MEPSFVANTSGYVTAGLGKEDSSSNWQANPATALPYIWLAAFLTRDFTPLSPILINDSSTTEISLNSNRVNRQDPVADFCQS